VTQRGERAERSEEGQGNRQEGGKVRQGGGKGVDSQLARQAESRHEGLRTRVRRGCNYSIDARTAEAARDGLARLRVVQRLATRMQFVGFPVK
jgi:hypothetical protein